MRPARCVADDGRPVRRAAQRFGASHTAAARWAERYRQSGLAGLRDRSSRPRHQPAGLPPRSVNTSYSCGQSHASAPAGQPPGAASHRAGPGRGDRRPTATAGPTLPRTLLDERACIRLHTSDHGCQAALPDWLDWYNRHRTHTGIDGRAPAGPATHLSGPHRAAGGGNVTTGPGRSPVAARTDSTRQPSGTRARPASHGCSRPSGSTSVYGRGLSTSTATASKDTDRSPAGVGTAPSARSSTPYAGATLARAKPASAGVTPSTLVTRSRVGVALQPCTGEPQPQHSPKVS
ncbi:leucine zipper domain-containing protein [Streptomyces sp. NPDC023723]|uniref:helix-turn-helix domain-containing protein n=1 Tax=Streptomyces sp. NPDC023723 TaxID=3154323 RepID=UPI0033D4DDD0